MIYFWDGSFFRKKYCTSRLSSFPLCYLILSPLGLVERELGRIIDGEGVPQGILTRLHDRLRDARDGGKEHIISLDEKSVGGEGKIYAKITIFAP